MSNDSSILPRLTHYQLWTMVAILIISTSGYRLIGNYYDGLMAQEKEAVRTKIVDEEFTDKRRAIEQTFKLVYETLRTISLFPDVRAIKGGNRLSDQEDVVKDNRFTQGAHDTVQQLYNNLASNVPISEIYAVIDGLDPAAGQVPFFMYDSLILGANHDLEKGDLTENDVPEESEEAEYRFFPIQMAALKQTYPRFDFVNLNQIPVAFSPLMRTCDNSQYVSKVHGQIHDAEGFVYSVPFYDLESGIFKGIITAILRANVLEAQLLGVPFLIITDGDRELARQRNFALPEQPSAFVLTSETYGITVADRRAPGLVDQARNAQGTHSSEVIRAPLDIAGDGHWRLAYVISPATYDQALQGLKREAWLVQSGFLFSLVLLALVGGLFALLQRRREAAQIETITQFIRHVAADHPDLTERIDTWAVHRKMVPIADQLNQFVEKMHRLLRSVTDSFGQADGLAKNVGSEAKQVREAARQQVQLIDQSMRLADESHTALQHADGLMSEARTAMQSNATDFEGIAKDLLGITDRIRSTSLLQVIGVVTKPLPLA